MIRVIGGSASQKKHVTGLVNFCIKKLMPRMDLDITVRLKKIDPDTYGYCLSDPEGDAERLDRPRTFELEIQKKMPLRKLLETVAHEMVHVKQYARGELYQSGVTGLHRWHGEWVTNDPDYWDCPWEWEAMGRETALFVQYVQSEKLNKRKWTKDS